MPEAHKPSVRRILLRIVLRGFLGILGLGVLLIGALFIFEKQWGARIVQEGITQLNAHLNVPISTTDVEFTFFRNFPHASLRLRNVIIHGTHPEVFGEEDTLLVASQVFIVLDPLPMLRGEYTATRTIIDKGFLWLKEHAKGINNYSIQFITKDTTPRAPSSASLLFDHLELKQIMTTYQSQYSTLSCALAISQLQARLHLQAQALNLKLKGQTLIEEITHGEFTYAKNQHLTLEGALHLQQDTLTVQNTTLSLDEQTLYAEGFYVLPTQQTHIDITSERLSLRTLLSFASQFRWKPPSTMNLRGTIQTHLTLTGSLQPKQGLTIDLRVQGQDLEVKNKGIRYDIETLDAQFSNGTASNLTSTKIIVNQIKVKQGDSHAIVQGQLVNFQHPTIYLKAQTFLNQNQPSLEKWAIPHYNHITFQGEVLASFSSFDSLSLRQMINPRINGEITFHDLHLTLPSSLGTLIMQGEYTLQGQDIVKGALLGSLNEKTHFSLGLNMKNVLAYVTQQGNAHWSIAANIRNVNADTLIALLQQPTQDTIEEPIPNTDTVSQITPQKKLPSHTLQAECRLTSSILWGTPIDTALLTLHMQADEIRAHIQQLVLLGGDLRGTLLYRSLPNQTLLTASLQPRAIDLKKLFQAAHNFNQTTITAHNLAGALSGNVQLTLPFIQKKPQLREMNMQATLEVVQGALDSVKALEKLSTFISLNELRSIRFNRLINTITLKEGVITIPRMQVESSALTLFVEGTHRLTSEYYYAVNLRLSDLLFNRLRLKRQDIKDYSVSLDTIVQPTDPEGLLPQESVVQSKGGLLFFIIEGDSVSSQVRFDNQALGNYLSQQVKKEKEEINRLLREESSTPDTVVKKSTPVFSIEWEEDTITSSPASYVY